MYKTVSGDISHVQMKWSKFGYVYCDACFSLFQQHILLVNIIFQQMIKILQVIEGRGGNGTWKEEGSVLIAQQ